MTATLDVLQLPPYGQGQQRFALVLAGWDGPALPAEQLETMAKAVGAITTVVFAQPIVVGGELDDDAALVEAGASLTVKLRPQVDKNAMAQLLDSVRHRVTKAADQAEQAAQTKQAAPRAEAEPKARSTAKRSSTES